MTTRSVVANICIDNNIIIYLKLKLVSFTDKMLLRIPFSAILKEKVWQDILCCLCGVQFYS